MFKYGNNFVEEVYEKDWLILINKVYVVFLNIVFWSKGFKKLCFWILKGIIMYIYV